MDAQFAIAIQNDMPSIQKIYSTDVVALGFVILKSKKSVIIIVIIQKQ